MSFIPPTVFCDGRVVTSEKHLRAMRQVKSTPCAKRCQMARESAAMRACDYVFVLHTRAFG